MSSAGKERRIRSRWTDIKDEHPRTLDLTRFAAA
jgi:hypothetical protein